MKYSKIDENGNPISEPLDLSQIVKGLPVTLPNSQKAVEDYVLSLGYEPVPESTIPQVPADLMGKCMVTLGIPKRDLDGKLVRTYDFREIPEARLKDIGDRNRRKRDDILAKSVDSINAVRWAAMTPEKQQEWVKFRQDLLDLSNQPGWPANLTWPGIPQD